MTMLVTKFSDGKYQNDGELFAEPISENNVKLMGDTKTEIRNAELLYERLETDASMLNSRNYERCS